MIELTDEEKAALAMALVAHETACREVGSDYDSHRLWVRLRDHNLTKAGLPVAEELFAACDRINAARREANVRKAG